MPETPTSSCFVHLRVHSEFSVVDGTVRLPDLIAKAVAFNQPAIALTDLTNLFGLIKFYKAARGAGIKPLAGCDMWVTNDQDRDKPSRILLLVANHQGYLKLCELLTQAWLTNAYRGKGEIRREWLNDCEGLIALSGASSGDIGQALLNGQQELARALAREWARCFPNAFYIELQRRGSDVDETYVQAALGLASDCGLPVVATHPVQFLEKDEFRAHEARVCIAEGQILTDPRRPKAFTEDQYLLSSEEMVERFSDIPSALANTIAIAKRCNLTLELGRPRLPDFPTPEGVSLDDYLFQLSEAGLTKRMAQAGQILSKQPEYLKLF